jgi:hypothetical protein
MIHVIMVNVIMVSQSSDFHRIRLQGSSVGDIETPISVIYHTLTIICLGMNSLCFMELLTRLFMLELDAVITLQGQRSCLFSWEKGLL